jgi:hypothetical protein
MPASGPPAGIDRHVTADERQDLTLTLDAEKLGSSHESGGFQVPQILVHCTGPRARRPQKLFAAPGDALCHPSPRKRSLHDVRGLLRLHVVSMGDRPRPRGPQASGFAAE